MQSNGNKQQLKVGEPFNPHHVFNSTNSIFTPEAMIGCRRISANAKFCYGFLRRFADKSGRCFPEHAKLAEILGISKRQVQRCIAALVNDGWLRADGKGYFYVATEREETTI